MSFIVPWVPRKKDALPTSPPYCQQACCESDTTGTGTTTPCPHGDEDDGPQEMIVTLEGDYDTIVGDKKTLFLQECSTKLAPVECTDVQPGSCILHLFGNPSDLDDSISSISDECMALPGFDPLCVEDSELWPQVGPDNARCVSRGSYATHSQQACQRDAVANGDPYYQFKADTMKCATDWDCDTPVTGLRGPWKIYHAGQSWPALCTENCKCSQGGSYVGSLLACQQIAVDNAVRFYQYNSKSKKCATKELCDSPYSVKSDWNVYENPLPPTTSTTSTTVTTTTTITTTTLF